MGMYTEVVACPNISENVLVVMTQWRKFITRYWNHIQKPQWKLGGCVSKYSD